MDRLTGATMDIVKENIEQLKRIFPDVFTEGKIDFDRLCQVLSDFISEDDEAYSFTWSGKAQAKRLAQTPTTGTLRPCKEDSKNWDSTKNLYIEGDNLEVLKLLQKSYFGKVKMIYIDPPYNTGKDFVYKDNFHDSIQNYKEITGQVDGEGKRVSTNTESDGRYHTNWLNMMYPRLRLARNLLTEDGVIFISIDDNEVANLRKICDEIFGEDNFIAQLVWTNKEGGGGSDSKLIRIKHEYILVYAKTVANCIINGVKIENEERYSKEDEYVSVRGKYYLQPLSMGSLGYIESLDYPITAPDGAKVYPNLNNKKINRWRWGKDKVEWGKENGYLEFIKDKNNNWLVFTKQYLYADNEGNIIVRTNRPFALIDKYSSTGASKKLQLMLEGRIFDYSKPVELIKYLLEISTNATDIILDFFSGSAATAHAVMQLNAEDGGKRQYIMVQLPELTEESSEAYKAGYKNICEIGKERIRRAGEKIKEEKGMLAEDLDIGFKVFKLDSSNILEWVPPSDNKDVEALKQKLIGMGQVIVTNRTHLDVVYEIMLKMGLDLTYPVEELTFADKKVYSVGAGALMICLADSVPLEIAEEMLKYEDINPELTRIVFSDKSFKDDSTKLSVKERFTQAGFDKTAFMTI